MADTALALTTDSSRALEAIRDKMSFQKGMRALLVQYVRDEMDKERHFYMIEGATKPGLSQDGARMLCTLYNVRAGDTELHEVWADDGHYHVRATVRLYSRETGNEVTQGTGSCSTREGRYAYRWLWADNPLLSTMNKADLERRPRGKQFQYKAPNPDLADQYNTVLKMAEKRAQTAAVMRLDCVPDVFAEPQAQDEEREEQDAADRKELVRLIVAWTKELPRGTRGRAFKAVFGEPYESLSSLSNDQLDSGYGLAERAGMAGIDWRSLSLDADLSALDNRSAEQAKSDLFGDQEEVTKTRMAATQPGGEAEQETHPASPEQRSTFSNAEALAPAGANGATLRAQIEAIVLQRKGNPQEFLTMQAEELGVFEVDLSLMQLEDILNGLRA